jgi:hypothetical protein
MITQHMKHTALRFVATVFFLASQAAYAQEPDPTTPREGPPAAATPEIVNKPDLSEIANRLRSFITDDEMSLLYDFMSDSAIAALGGDEVAPLPPELEFKLEILRERFYKEGNAVMQGFKLFLQQELDNTLKKLQRPPPPSQPAPDRG